MEGFVCIEKLEKLVIDCEGINISTVISDKDNQITLGSIIIAALIDSINPCAFGVLIFLMASLLKMGSSRRALRAGLIYSLVVSIFSLLSIFWYCSAKT